MTAAINLTNSYQDRNFVKSSITQEVDKKKIDSKVSNSLSKDCINHLSNTLQSQIQPSLGKETLLSLQELQESTSELLNPQKAEGVTLQKESVVDDTPRLSWLIGKDDEMHDSYVRCLSSGAKSMAIFSEIVSRTKNDRFISHKDMVFLQSKVISFQMGLDIRQEARVATSDPIVHKVIDYVMPKTRARLQLIKDYLALKELDPVEAAKIKEKEAAFDSLSNYIKTRGKSDFTSSFPLPKITETVNFKSDDTTQKLLEFLVKDLRWYDWYLRDDASEPFESLPLTKAAA